MGWRWGITILQTFYRMVENSTCCGQAGVLFSLIKLSRTVAASLSRYSEQVYGGPAVKGEDLYILGYALSFVDAFFSH